MNAMRRSDAVQTLEAMAWIIAVHAVLVASYPENQDANHWRGELNGFVKTLRRYHKGKGGRKNYTMDMLTDELFAALAENDENEAIAMHIEEKGLDPDLINWQCAKDVLVQFGLNVLEINK